MVITKMSGGESSEQKESIRKAKARINQIQYLLNLAYNSLLLARSSNSTNAHLKLNQIQLQEMKMLRYFAKQLKEKHTELHALEDPELRAEIEKEFNGLISLEKFMALAEIERKDVQTMLGPALNLSMDGLFQASDDQLESMFEDLNVSQISQRRLKTRLADLKEVYEERASRDRSSTTSERLSSVSVPYEEDSLVPRGKTSDCFVPYTPPATPPVFSPRPHYPPSVMVTNNDRGSVESMPAAVRRNHWLSSRKPGSLESSTSSYGRHAGVPSLYRSSEQINQVQLPVPPRHQGHMRTRSLGNDITLSTVSSHTGGHTEQETRIPIPSPLPSPTPLAEVSRTAKHRSPPVMVKQASLGTYTEQSQNFNASGDDFGESSSLVCFNSYSDGDDDVVTGKAQSVPRLANLSIPGEYPHVDPNGSFTRSLSEVVAPGDHYPGPPPTSPRTQGTNTPVGLVGHRIPHRFSSRSFFHSTVCDFCKKGMILGVRCKQCKYKCHKNCQKKVPASCGLTQALEDVFKQMMLCPSPAPSVENFTVTDHSKEPTKNQSGQSVVEKKYETIVGTQNTISVIHNPAHITSTSTSSISSASLSPATPISPKDKTHFFNGGKGSEVDDSSGHDSEARDSDIGSSVSHSHGSSSCDDFSDNPRLEGAVKRGLRPSPQIVSVVSLPNLHRPKVATFVSNSAEGNLLRGGSPSLVHTTGSSITTSTLTNDSLGLVESEMGSTTTTLVNSVNSDIHGENLVDGEDGFNLGDSVTSQQFQREWEIPYHDLANLCPISKDPFTGVQTLRGYWHGEVMIKKFPVPNATAQQVERFITDVAALKHCRHENVLLFMGICSQPPDLAVITSDFKGVSLHKHIHVWTETFHGRRAHHIIKQVAQGMGYLHDKGIVHKDLTSRHILLDDKDKDKVVITDVGFNSVTDCQLFPGMRGKLMIPRGWLNYQAPEILKVLSPYEACDKYYTFQSDIYAFGVLWYELLTGTWPFESYEPEQIIYLVGNSSSPNAELVTSTTNVKDILTKCWSYDPDTRIPFAKMLEDLKKRMPVTRIASHPAKLSKSMDSIF